MNYYLPTTIEINENEYEIRSDYRAILDICIALSDVELTDGEKSLIVLQIFYPEWQTIPRDDIEEALIKCMDFISCGEKTEEKPKPRLVDWEKDFNKVIAPINKMIGRDIRGDDYMHWWTFVSLYTEIDSECTFSQIVRIRAKRAKHQKLTKDEEKWYRENRSMIDIKTQYTEKETDTINQWLGGEHG